MPRSLPFEQRLSDDGVSGGLRAHNKARPVLASERCSSTIADMLSLGSQSRAVVGAVRWSNRLAEAFTRDSRPGRGGGATKVMSGCRSTRAASARHWPRRERRSQSGYVSIATPSTWSPAIPCSNGLADDVAGVAVDRLTPHTACPTLERCAELEEFEGVKG